MAGYLRKMTFFVLDGKSTNEVMEERGWIPSQFESEKDWKEAVEKRIKCHDVELLTSDNRAIEALWTSRHFGVGGPTSFDSGDRSVVILFHANAQIGLDLCEWARWYRNRSIDALIVTMGGYGGSQGNASESTAYLDAQAALDWVLGTQNVPINKIIAHGLSIGGSLACALGDANPGLHLVLDQTFTNASATAHHIANTKLPMGEMGLIPDWAVSGIVASCFPSGQTIEVYPYAAPPSTRPVIYTTDGLDNIGKLKRMRTKAQVHDTNQYHFSPPSNGASSSSKSETPLNHVDPNYRNCEVFFFSATEDDMMPPSFARELLIARYGYGFDDESESDEEDQTDDEAEGGEEGVGNNGALVKANGGGGGFFSWFRRGKNPPQDDTQENSTDTNNIDNDDNDEDSSVLTIPPSSSSDNTNISTTNTQNDLTASKNVDSVLSTLTTMLLCGDDSRNYDNNNNNSTNDSTKNKKMTRKEKREARKMRREANAMHLEAMRSARFALLEGPHGTFFGGHRKAVSLYEAFLRNSNLLPAI